MSEIYVFQGKDITMTVCLVMREVCRIIAQERHISFFDALMDFFGSETCEDLQNVENGFWAESPDFIADRFFEEIGLPELVER